MYSLYLIGVNREPSSFTGLEIIRKGSDSWFAGPYALVKSKSFISTKKELVELNNEKMGRKTEVKVGLFTKVWNDSDGFCKHLKSCSLWFPHPAFEHISTRHFHHPLCQ